MQQFVGIDWATRRARWCAVTSAGVVIDEGWAPADEDGLAGLVMRLGPEASACMEMMSGAAWVRERLQAAGWTVQIADARKAKAVGSLAAKTDKLDARVLAELARRDLVPQVHVPTFADREAQGTPRPPHAHDPPADRGDQPRPRSPEPVRRPARVRPTARAMPRSCWSRAASRRSGGARSPKRSRSCECSTSA